MVVSVVILFHQHVKSLVVLMTAQVMAIAVLHHGSVMDSQIVKIRHLAVT